MDCTPPCNSSRHVRLHLPVTWDWVNPKKEDFVVLSVWAGSGAGTLLVASGVGNETEHYFDGYRYIVVVTWCKGYTSNPAWFPALLVSVANCLCKPHGERMDVFGVSRGAQAVICCFDVGLGLVDAAADILNNVVLCGGCIWERGDHDLPRRVLEGLAHVERIWFRSPLRAVVVSEMDASVWKRGKTSKNDNGYRVDFADFSEQVRSYTQKLVVLNFAGHDDVLNVGKLITFELKRSPTKCVRDEVHLTRGVLEEALMRVVGDSEGSPWLIPGQQSRKDAEADGAPRLTSGNAGQQSARRVRPCVFQNRLESCGWLPRNMEKELQTNLKVQLRGRHLSWIFGGTGVGKSRRAPRAALMSLEDDVPKGVLHVLPRKLASYSLLDFYWQSEYEEVRNMASIWHGDVKEMPTQREFVVFSTPVSAYHRFRTAKSWQDLSFIVFDEVQVKDGLMALCILYVLDLIVNDAPLAKGVRVLLMTATPFGPAYSMLKSALDLMGVRTGSVTLSPCADWSTFARLPLWEVVNQPDNWHRLSEHSKVITALILMTDYLWVYTYQSASILIFVAGESEVFKMRNAIVFSQALKDVRWKFEVQTLWGRCPWNVESDVRERLEEHVFYSDAPALFTILTPGKGEDGWTPKVNGVINCSEQMDVDKLGFLNKNPSDEVSNTQREGRAGRVAHSVFLHLAKAAEPSTTWSMPYAEKIQVALAARDLQFAREIPGLSAAERKAAEADLVKGDIVLKFFSCGILRASLIFISLWGLCMGIQSAAKLHTGHRAIFAIILSS